MFQQVIDFRDESEALYQLLRPLADEQFARPTQFKDWTIDDVIGHLHIWNRAAALSLADPEAFRQFLAEVMAAAQKGGMRAFEREWRGELAGRALLEAWRELYLPMCERFGEADPKAREIGRAHV